jgi:hypothetical protein
MPPRPLAAAVLVLACVPACNRGEDRRGAAATALSTAALVDTSPEVLDSRDPSRLARVRPGMTEVEVATALGRPDEIHTRDAGRLPWIAGASFAWAYGVLAPGGFAAGGRVLFDAGRKVITTRSPIDADPVRPMGPFVPWKETPRPTSGLSCHLHILGTDPLGPEARVTLRNDGATPLSRRHGHTGIRFDLIIEIFDADRHLLARCDTKSLFSPVAPGDTEVMTIPPDGSISDTVHLGVCLNEHGPLPPGAYFARVAFPFEEGRFTPSDLVPMPVGGPQPR